MSIKYPRERMTWMDQLRGIAIVLVLLQHTVSIGTRVGVDAWLPLVAFNSILAPYRIPLLLFLSGMLLSVSLSKPFWAYVDGKARKILWPLLVWSVPTLLLRPPDSIKAAFGAAHLWYLYVLIACYAIALLTRWIHPIALAGLMYLSVYIVPYGFPPFSFVPNARNIAWFGAFFMIGAASVKIVPWWQKRVPWWVAAVLGVVSLGWGLIPSTSSIGHYSPMELPMSVVGISAIIWIAPRVRTFRPVENVGRESIIWYVAHAPVMMAVAPHLVGLPSVLAAVLLLTSAVAVCWTLVRLGNRSVVSFLFEWPPPRKRALKGSS